MSRHPDNKPSRALRGRAGRMQGGRGSGRGSAGTVRLWGRHAVEAALKNPERNHRKLWATREGIASLDGELPADFPIEYAQPADLARQHRAPARLVVAHRPHQRGMRGPSGRLTASARDPRPRPLRLFEHEQGIVRVFAAHIGRAQPGLRPRIARIDGIRPAEETDRRIDIAYFQRGKPRIDQRRGIAGIGGQPLQSRIERACPPR